LVRRGLVPSRALAQRAIAEGRVVVGSVPTPRPASLVDEQASLSLVDDGPHWASRGGIKLAAALDAFGVDPAGRRCLDVGASTGGFTDVLLARGAASVAAVDVGYGQLDWRLRSDPRVTAHDRTNFRTVAPGPRGAPFDLVTVDVSFISLSLLAPNLLACGQAGTDYVVLVKPQFEVGREYVGRGGLVVDPALHRAAVQRVVESFAAVGLGARAACPSPITGATGNREFFVHARPGDAATLELTAIAQVVGA
jgi:23S rRNA (cytidine1920-2'-O)/16S rRNA (cytidine1409-2'-O)-methyltransferase